MPWIADCYVSYALQGWRWEVLTNSSADPIPAWNISLDTDQTHFGVSSCRTHV